MITAKLARIALALFCASALLVAPRVARAGDQALAEALFEQGKKLLEQGKFDEACPKFEASQRQDPSPGTLLNLGKCNEGRGKTATAWANYKEAEALARNMSRQEQQQLAAERAATLEPTLSHLTIHPPPSAVEGLVVKRGGVAMSADSLGVAAPADPGDYAIEASAPGYESWSGKVTVGKNKDEASISIPALKKSAVAPPAATPTPPATGAPAPPASSHASTAGSGGSTKTIGYVLTGVGAVGLLVGGYFGLAAKSQASDAENDPKLCPNKICTPDGRSEIDSAKSKALISTIGIGAGVAALGAGLVLIVTSPSNKEQVGLTSPRRAAKPSAHFTPYLDGRNAGMFVSGAF